MHRDAGAAVGSPTTRATPQTAKMTVTKPHVREQSARECYDTYVHHWLKRVLVCRVVVRFFRDFFLFVSSLSLCWFCFSLSKTGIRGLFPSGSSRCERRTPAVTHCLVEWPALAGRLQAASAELTVPEACSLRVAPARLARELDSGARACRAILCFSITTFGGVKLRCLILNRYSESARILSAVYPT